MGSLRTLGRGQEWQSGWWCCYHRGPRLYGSLPLTGELSGPQLSHVQLTSSLTNIIKADKGTQTQERLQSAAWSVKLLDVVAELLETEGPEERVKLCFVLGKLRTLRPETCSRQLP